MAINTEKIVVQVVVKGQKDLDNLSKKTGKATKGVGGLTKGFAGMAAGALAAVAAFRQIGKVIGSAIKTFTAFEFQMAKVRAISGATDKEFGLLNKTAQELGRTTFFTATQVAELQTNYSKLGFVTEEILLAQEATLNLATATGSDLARAAIVAGAAVRGFGLDASETGRVTDVMTLAFASSALDIEKWQTSMTKVAPIAAGMNIEIEETAAIMGTLTDAGIEASIAGTSMRNIFLQMADKSSKLAKHLGFTVNSSDDLSRAIEKLGEASKDTLRGLVNIRQVAAFNVMIKGAERVSLLTDKLNGAGGSAARLAAIIEDTTEGAMKRLTSATEGLAIEIFERFGGAMKSSINTLSDWINKITDNSEVIKSVIDKVSLLTKLLITYKAVQIASTIATIASTAAIVLYELATGTASFATKRLIVQVRLLTRTMNKNPYILLGSLLVALSTDMFNLRTEVTATKDAWKELNDAVFGAAGKFKERQELIQLLKDEVVSYNELSKAKGHILKIDREITASEKSRESVRQQAIVNTEAMVNWTDDLKDAYIANTLADHDRGIQILKNQKVELSSAISKARVTEEINKDTDATDENIKAKEQSLELEREIVELLMNQGVTSKEEEVRIQEYLNGLREKEIELQLKSLNEFVMDVDLRKKLLLELEALKSGTDEDDQKRKEDSFQADVKRAIMSGQTAEEAMKTVVRAQIMEAVAGYISSVFVSTPFPFNLILAAGASAAVGGLVDKTLSKFGNGGMIEEFANGGMVNGKSHAQGGEKFAVGGRVVELEGGEAVINKRSTSMFRGQLSAMNAAGGGVKFADGGLLNQPSFTQQQFNAVGQSNMMGSMERGRKVVVVEADITDTQNSISVIESEATF